MTPGQLKQLRAKSGMSQRAAAEALGVSLPTYQSWELGKSWKTGLPIVISKRNEIACRNVFGKKQK